MAARPRTPIKAGAAVWMAPPAWDEVEVAPARAEVAELIPARTEDDTPAKPEEMLAIALEAEASAELRTALPDDSAPAMADVAEPVPLEAPPAPKMVVDPIVEIWVFSPSTMVERTGAVVIADPLAVSVTVPVTEVTRVVSVDVTAPPAPPAPPVADETASDAALVAADAAEVKTLEIAEPAADETAPPALEAQN